MNGHTGAATSKGYQLRRKRGLNLDLNQPLLVPDPNYGADTLTLAVPVIDLDAIDDSNAVYISDSDSDEVTRIKTRRNSRRTTPGTAAAAARTLEQPKRDQAVTAYSAAFISCPICMGPLDEETSTRCGHIFCKSCIKRAMAVKAICPTCRKRLNKRGLIRVFLPAIGTP